MTEPDETRPENSKPDSKARETLEFAKAGIDVFKHITTLASGSIVVLVALGDKFKQPHGRSMLATAITLFLTSMLSGCYGLHNWLGIVRFGPEPDTLRELKRASNFSFVTLVLGFLVLGLYASLNYLADR
jgi:hypothetical protein